MSSMAYWNEKMSERQTKAGDLELSRTLFSRTLTFSRWSLGHDMRKPLPLQCIGWLRKLESRREMLDGASVARLQWDKHLPETARAAIYRSSDLQSMMFVPFSKDFCGDQYLYLLFIPTLVKILRSHCSLLPTTSSKSGFFLTKVQTLRGGFNFAPQTYWNNSYFKNVLFDVHL